MHKIMYGVKYMGRLNKIIGQLSIVFFMENLLKKILEDCNKIIISLNKILNIDFFD